MHAKQITYMCALAAMWSRIAFADLQVIDFGFASGGGAQGNPVCSPACRVIIDGDLGCHGTADFVGACRRQTGDNTVDVDACDGFHLEWSVSGDNADGVLFLENDSGTVGVDVHGCKIPESKGQCVYDGGCTVDN